MTIQITKPEVEALINQRLQSGAFRDAEDVILQALQAAGPAHRAVDIESRSPVFEQGLGLFGSPEDAALLDEVVSIAYEERRRPS
jgi:hypothetical protein